MRVDRAGFINIKAKKLKRSENYSLLRHIVLMMEAVRTSETSVYYEATRRYIPEGIFTLAAARK
jgi:hypothetical protein